MQIKRNLELDKYKGFLIWLVVLGHLLEPLLYSEEILRAVYLFIYLFHMPAFVFLVGVTSKTSNSSDAKSDKFLINLFVILLVMVIFYESFHLLLHHEISQYGINFSPYWHLWFLLSLISWKLLLPYAIKIRFHVALSVIFALSIGLSSQFGYALSLSRTFYFLPFFLLGAMYSPSVLTKQIKKLPVALAVTAIIIGFSLCWRFGQQIPIDISYGSNSYANLEQALIVGLIVRALLFVIAFSLFMCVFRLVLMLPDNQTIFRMGRNSLIIYLFHAFFIKLILVYILPVVETSQFYLVILFCLSVSILLVVLLSQDKFKAAFLDFIVLPVTKILFPTKTFK